MINHVGDRWPMMLHTDVYSWLVLNNDENNDGYGMVSSWQSGYFHPAQYESSINAAFLKLLILRLMMVNNQIDNQINDCYW